mgnify:CR=1 FL=1
MTTAFVVLAFLVGGILGSILGALSVIAAALHGTHGPTG